jgi:alginate O-acetyltransferase complex protein AlgI
MLFNSYPFLFVYLPLVLTGFFFLSWLRLTKAAKAWLLLGSLCFYAYWDIRFLPLLLASILFNYAMGSLILKAPVGAIKKGILLFGISADLLLLFYFKYFNFFSSIWLGHAAVLNEMILPLGISFFTFTQIAYLVDAYKGEAEKSDPLSYGLFVTVFPHLIAGPILHHKEMLSQFNSLRMYVVSWSNISQGIFLFITGLFKKVLIADSLSGFVASIFDQALPNLSFIQAWFGSLAYTLQLYFDFSGYSDMAVGLGLLFNLHLPINFNSPYQADSIIDFWRRWHITLSQFLRDYLYIPLGGNRNGAFAKLRNLFITMLLGGLWHGAGWTFIVWGACHGFCLAVNHVWRSFKINIPSWLARGLTLLTIICTWVVFRSPTLEVALDILKGMFGLNGIILPERYHFGVLFAPLINSEFRWHDMVWILFLLACTLFIPNSHYWQKRFKRRPLVWAVPCAVIFVLALLQLDDLKEFLYYQF